MKKAVALLSGGLDSTLAVKLILDQGIEVAALNFTSAFCNCSGGKNKEEKHGCKNEAMRVAQEFNIPVKVLVKGLDYFDIVRNPKYGYGKGINPCVDCRIYMFKLAKKYMEEIGASFIVTGEVLGQRPMSQRRDTFKIIEKESGLEGLILRPLSAKFLKPTIPETLGIVDRRRLLSIEGRKRTPQMTLAGELGVNDYPCPSGGCLLTDKIFSKKVRDLMDHQKGVAHRDLHILKVGRHFRYNGAKIVVSKNESENLKLKNRAEKRDTILEPMDFPGPVAMVFGENPNGAVEMAGRLILRYASSKAETGKSCGKIRIVFDGKDTVIEVKDYPSEKTVEGMHIC